MSVEKKLSEIKDIKNQQEQAKSSDENIQDGYFSISPDLNEEADFYYKFAVHKVSPVLRMRSRLRRDSL